MCHMTDMFINLIMDLQNIKNDKRRFKFLRSKISVDSWYNNIHKFINKNNYLCSIHTYEFIDFCQFYNKAESLGYINSIDIKDKSSTSIKLYDYSDYISGCIGIITVDSYIPNEIDTNISYSYRVNYRNHDINKLDVILKVSKLYKNNNGVDNEKISTYSLSDRDYISYDNNSIPKSYTEYVEKTSIEIYASTINMIIDLVYNGIKNKIITEQTERKKKDN